jgi:putative endonuclease
MDLKCYTFKRRPVELVHLETFGEIMDAIAREKQIKRWSRRKKEALIKGEDQTLFRLSTCQNTTSHIFKTIDKAVSPRAEPRGGTAS